jgi:hypothetical protein
MIKPFKSVHILQTVNLGVVTLHHDMVETPHAYPELTVYEAPEVTDVCT